MYLCQELKNYFLKNYLWNLCKGGYFVFDPRKSISSECIELYGKRFSALVFHRNEQQAFAAIESGSVIDLYSEPML